MKSIKTNPNSAKGSQEKTLSDISFKLETKIMNFMSVFFRKKYNQVNSRVVNNMQYNLFTIFPLSGPFAEFGFYNLRNISMKLDPGVIS
jgi:hypothetical protein